MDELLKNVLTAMLTPSDERPSEDYETKNECLCGEPLDECPDAYAHITGGA